MRLIDVDVYCATICRCNRRECDKAKCPIHNAPTAYDIDKVVRQLNLESVGSSIQVSLGLLRAIEIVKQGGVSDDVCEWKSASEYNNGWIPCSEMLPDDFMSMAYLTTVKGHLYPEINYYCVANHKWFSNEKTTKEAKVIAWMPLPVAFKERD